MPLLWERDRVRVGSMAQAVVCIVMGSANDWPIMQGAAEMLARFHIPYEVTVQFCPPGAAAYGCASA